MEKSFKYVLPQLGVDVRINLVTDTEEQFKEVRRQVSRDLRDLTKQVADDTVLPRANVKARFVRSVTGQGLAVRKGFGNNVYLTPLARGKLKRVAGYLEFGYKDGKGELAKPITPRPRGRRRVAGAAPRRSTINPGHAGALKMPDGRFVYSTGITRKWKGKHQIHFSVKESIPSFQNELGDRVLAYFQTAGFEIS